MAETGTLRIDKRRAILDAAGPVFSETGYDRASVDAIAAEGGVSKPTIYAYFGSKEQLFRDTLTDIARQLYEASYDAVRNLDLHPDRWRASLHDLGYALATSQRTGCTASLSRLAVAESRRDPEALALVQRAGFEPVREALAGRFAMLANAGVLNVPDAGLAAHHFLALTQATLPELTGCGAMQGDDGAIRSATDAGVDAFLRAYAVAPD